MTDPTECRRGSVTVVISTYNRARFIKYSIDSLLNQTVSPSRIVVVDDGSTDETPRVLASYGNQIEVYHQTNSGKAHALNAVLPSVETTFVWFFDDDDVALPTALESLLGAHEQENNLGFTFGHSYRSSAIGCLTIEGATERVYPYAHKTEQEQRLHFYHSYKIAMSASLLRTSAVNAVGRLNVDLQRAQDYDLMVRLVAGFPFRYCGSPVSIFRTHPGTRGSGASSHGSEDRARVWAESNRHVGCYLRYSIPIDFLRRDTSTAISDAESLREALLTRAWVTANKLPVDFAIRDLAEVCRWDPPNRLNEYEATLVRETLGHEHVIYQGRIPWLQIMALAMTPAGADVVANLSKGLFWLWKGQPRSLWRWRILAACLVIHAFAQIVRFFHRYMPNLSFFRLKRSMLSQ